MSAEPLHLVADAADLQYRITVHGGASGGINSAMHVVVITTKQPHTASSQTVSKYGILLDAGGLAMPPAAIDEGGELVVLCTHAHSDHCSGIPALAAARNLCGGRTRVLLPEADGAVEKLRAMISLSEELNAPGSDPLRYAVALRGVQMGVAQAEAPLDGPAGRVVLPIATRHRVASTGYVLVHRKQKVRHEHTLDSDGTPLSKAALGRRIKELKAAAPASAIFDVEEQAELAYTGDTSIDWLEGDGDFGRAAVATALRAKVLITEATFICDDVSCEQAAERGHTHLDQIASCADRFDGVGHLVLTHFSRRYTRRQIEEALDRKLPPELRAKTHALIHSGHHRDGAPSQ